MARTENEQERKTSHPLASGNEVNAHAPEGQLVRDAPGNTAVSTMGGTTGEGPSANPPEGGEGNEPDRPRRTAGGGEAEGSPRATSHQGQPAQGARPGGANTEGGALNTGPGKLGQGQGGNQ